MSTRIAGAFWTAVVLALASTATAQTAQTQPPNQFTFTVTNAAQANLSPEDRLDVRIMHWSSDADRDQLVAALKDGPAAVKAALWRQEALGYLDWPGYLQYVVRYAFRTLRPDGGEDVVLGFDRPVTVWWQGDTSKYGSDPSIPNTADFAVIQMRLNKAGEGEGRITMAAKLTSMPQLKALAMDNFESQPLIMTDVEHARPDRRSTN